MTEATHQTYQEIAREIRLKILEMMYRAPGPHIGSAYSIVEILVALYFKVLNITPQRCHCPQRDRFILSKGHACAALYAVLQRRGFIDEATLLQFGVNGGSLEHHPSYNPQWGIEFSSGSLGHGLSVATGMALADHHDALSRRVFVLLSDGELNEGSLWEAAMFAAHHGLGNLVALLDCNKIQALGPTREILDLEPLQDKWRAFGWHVQRLDGHDFREIFAACAALRSDRPNVLILDTVKGKGVSFMENRLLWHYRSPNDEEYEAARRELEQ